MPIYVRGHAPRAAVTQSSMMSRLIACLERGAARGRLLPPCPSVEREGTVLQRFLRYAPGAMALSASGSLTLLSHVSPAPRRSGHDGHHSTPIPER